VLQLSQRVAADLDRIVQEPHRQMDGSAKTPEIDPSAADGSGALPVGPLRGCTPS